MSKNKSTFFLCIVLTLLIFSAIACANTQPGTELQLERPQNIVLSWVNNPQTTQAISWQTSISNKCFVEYGLVEAGDTRPKKTKYLSSTPEKLNIEQPTVYLHHVNIENLQPKAKYLYRIGTVNTFSEWYSFETAPAIAGTPFKFLVFGDSQSVNYKLWQQVASTAYNRNKSARFFINMGDLVDMGDDYTGHWKGWFAGVKNVAEFIPAMPVSGNHENYSAGPIFTKAKLYLQQFQLPTNAPATFTKQMYSFDYGDVHFVVLDTQFGEQRAFSPDLAEIQLQWLQKDLQTTTKKWKLVFMHRPLHNKNSGDLNNIGHMLTPIFDKYHVNIVFTAHNHDYYRSFPLLDDVIVANSAQGTVYVGTGRSGEKVSKNVQARSIDEGFDPVDSQPNYLTVQVDDKFIQVQSIFFDGTIIDEFRVNLDSI